MRKGDELSVSIVDIGDDGVGIGKHDGHVYFIKDALIGDTVRAKVMKVKPKHVFAKLEEVLTPSPFRVQPPCRLHRSCGACQLQALKYEKQLEYKQNKVYNNLKRIGGFSDEAVEAVLEPIIGMEQPFGYRNKAAYPVAHDKEGNLIAGFYAGRTHDIIAVNNCLLTDERNKAVLAAVLSYMKENAISAYDEASGTGHIRHILVRTGHYSGELMLCLVVNADAPPPSHIAANADALPIDHVAAKADAPSIGHVILSAAKNLVPALSVIPGMASISINYNPGRTNVIMGRDTECIWGKATIADCLHVLDVKANFQKSGRRFNFHISPKSFYQVNAQQAEKLYSLMLDWLNLSGNETVWDLYSGIGTISIYMAPYTGMVYAVESVPESVRDARLNAAENNATNIHFLEGRVEDIFVKKCQSADIVIVNPPRKGLSSTCTEAIIQAKPERIIYLSCDSATLARDLRILKESGFRLARARPVDQFCHSVHVETLCLLVWESH